MKAKTFDRKFDIGEKIAEHLDISNASADWHRCEAGQRGFPSLDGRFPRPGGAATRRDAAIADQAMACRQTGAAGCRHQTLGLTEVALRANTVATAQFGMIWRSSGSRRRRIRGSDFFARRRRSYSACRRGSGRSHSGAISTFVQAQRALRDNL